MKKSILIGVLCALMLFTFAACEQTPVIPKMIESVTYEAGPTEYVTGQILDPSAYTLRVNYADGSSKTISGAGAIAADGKALAAGTEDVVITYGGLADQKFVVNVYDGKLTVTAPEGVAVQQGVENGKSWENLPNVEGLSVAIVYGPSNSVLELSADQYKLGANTSMTSSDIDETSTVSVTVSNESGRGGTTAASATFTAQRLAYEEPETLPTPEEPTKADVVSLRVKWTVDSKDAGTDAAITAHVGQTVAYSIVGVTISS